MGFMYDTSGKLKGLISGWVDPISGIYPVDFGFDGVFFLLAYQQIAGSYHADTVGTMQNMLKWNGYMFVLYYQDWLSMGLIIVKNMIYQRGAGRF